MPECGERNCEGHRTIARIAVSDGSRNVDGVEDPDSAVLDVSNPGKVIWWPRRDSNPQSGEHPDPRSGAFANFATGPKEGWS